MVESPTEIRRLGDGSGLQLSWSDGLICRVNSRELRLNCPCATCQELRGEMIHEKPLSGRRSSLQVIQHTVEEETRLQNIWAVGNYALGIRWGDKHDSGIYSFDLLRALSENSAEMEKQQG
jgi:DUF971 family protein